MLSERLRAIWYELLYYPASLLALLCFGLRIKGGPRVPNCGGLLVIANHQSYLDPPLVGMAVRRRLSYLARKSLFTVPGLAWLIRSLGAIPINQETGTEGIKATLALLNAGKAVLVFPEGGRSRDGTIQPLKPGIVILIRRAGCAILPVGIDGAYDIWPAAQAFPKPAPFCRPGPRRGIAVVVGNPIPAKTLAALPPEQMLSQCHEILERLRCQAERLRPRL